MSPATPSVKGWSLSSRPAAIEAEAEGLHHLDDRRSLRPGVVNLPLMGRALRAALPFDGFTDQRRQSAATGSGNTGSISALRTPGV